MRYNQHHVLVKQGQNSDRLRLGFLQPRVKSSKSDNYVSF